MIYLLAWWREFLLVVFLCLGYFCFDKWQDAKHELELQSVLHKGQITQLEIKAANNQIAYEKQRQEDLQTYATKINSINSKYSDLLNDNNRMREQITSFNSRISTATRQAVENYARTASTVYAECRSEYIKMGQYAEKLNAELDSVTKSPD